MLDRIFKLTGSQKGKGKETAKYFLNNYYGTSIKIKIKLHQLLALVKLVSNKIVTDV